MAVVTGNQIVAGDFNDLSNKIQQTLGNGAGQYGYGQSILSGNVSSGEIISKGTFDSLRFDIMSVLIHQTGNVPNPIVAQNTDAVLAEAQAPFKKYDSLISNARTNRFDVATSQTVTTGIGAGDGTPAIPGEYVTTASWSSSATLTVDMTFTDADECRHFFNSGGRVRITSTRTGGDSTQQNSSWTQTLSSAGERAFGAKVTGNLKNFYDLTDSYQTFYEITSSATYAANLYRLSAKCDVANNVNGTASVVNIKVELLDNYTNIPDGPPPSDEVNGTLAITVEEIKAAGFLQPDLDPFVITSPTFNTPSISVT